MISYRNKLIKPGYTYFQEMWSWGIKRDGISQGLWFHSEREAKNYCNRMNK